LFFLTTISKLSLFSELSDLNLKRLEEVSKMKGELAPNVEAVLGVASLGEQDSSKESFLVESLFSEVSF
jgi:hypothetical protein